MISHSETALFTIFTFESKHGSSLGKKNKGEEKKKKKMIDQGNGRD